MTIFKVVLNANNENIGETIVENKNINSKC